MSDKQKYLQVIDQQAGTFTGVSDKIWEYAGALADGVPVRKTLLRSAGKGRLHRRDAGRRASRPPSRQATAPASRSSASSPSSTPSAASPRRRALPSAEELVTGGNGHGCGHNMLGAGSLAAAFAVKKYLEDGHSLAPSSSTAAPARRAAPAKAFMARDRIWEELDAALTWHPGSVNQVTSGTCNTCIQTEYKFTGIASHAAGSPELGRSALDAVELMNVGVQFLREHMPQSARIHYAITDAGGNSPNVVQPHAQVLYMVRSVLAKDALALQERVDKIAQGAAMMTETTVKKRFIDGCSNTVPNKTLETLFWKNFNEVGVPTHTPEEVEYAKQIVASYEMTKNKLPGDACDEDAEIAEWVDKASEHGTVPLNDFLVPYHFSTKERPGSTDVGDVSWLVPTAQINVVTFPSNSPGHSWQNVSCGHTSIGHKGLLTAGKVIAATAIDLYENPQIIADAKTEFDKRAAGGYYCPVPEDAVPTVVGGQF